MPRGSGAIVVHRTLETTIPDYTVYGYDPRLEFAPPLMKWMVPRPDTDLVHTTPDHAVFFQQTNTPLIATFHNIVIDRFMWPYSTWAQRLHYLTDLRWLMHKSVRAADALTAVSQFTADLAKRELNVSRRIEVIPNGVDTERFQPANDSNDRKSLRLLFAGNPSIRKGAQWLPAIADRLSNEDRIVCATGLRGRWQSFLTHPRIEVLGGVQFEDMPAVYQSVDALLLPTVREGDSLVVLEAMSCGLPIIATRCSSLSERVEHGSGGFLCGIGETDEFANSVNELRDPQIRREMGRFNRTRAERGFSAKAMAERYTNFFARGH